MMSAHSIRLETPMSSQDWKRTKTAGRMPMRRSLEEQSELADELPSPAALAPTRPMTPEPAMIPIIAMWTGELARVPRGIDPAQLQAIEALAAMCALMGEVAGSGEVIEVEARAEGVVLSAVALDRRFVFMDYLAPGATRDALRQRAQHELNKLGGAR